MVIHANWMIADVCCMPATLGAFQILPGFKFASIMKGHNRGNCRNDLSRMWLHTIFSNIVGVGPFNLKIAVCVIKCRPGHLYVHVKKQKKKKEAP